METAVTAGLLSSPILAGAIITAAKMLMSHWTRQQDNKQLHEKGILESKQLHDKGIVESQQKHALELTNLEKEIADKHQQHERELSLKFEGIAKDFKDYASSEREDRKKVMEMAMSVHERTLTAIGEMKETLSQMRVSLDHNTRRLDEIQEISK